MLLLASTCDLQGMLLRPWSCIPPTVTHQASGGLWPMRSPCGSTQTSLFCSQAGQTPRSPLGTRLHLGGHLHCPLIWLLPLPHLLPHSDLSWDHVGGVKSHGVSIPQGPGRHWPVCLKLRWISAQTSPKTPPAVLHSRAYQAQDRSASDSFSRIHFICKWLFSPWYHSPKEGPKRQRGLSCPLLFLQRKKQSGSHGRKGTIAPLWMHSVFPTKVSPLMRSLCPLPSPRCVKTLSSVD